MPFGPYKDFQDCLSKNQDKRTPEAFCAFLHHKITGRWPAEKNVTAMTSNMIPCPVCSNPVKVNKALVRLKCPNCNTQLVSVRVRKVRRK